MAEPTIRTVADRAGVSKSLVSLVLRGSPQVSDDRRRAVLQAIDELGYRPNAAARSLSERRTHVIGVVLGDLRSPWSADCVDGIGAVLHPAGLTPLLGELPLSGGGLLHTFMDMRVDGLVLVGSMTPSAAITEAAARIPTVVAGSRDFDLPDLGAVDLSAQDDVLGARLAVEQLAELGHTRIAHLAGRGAAVAGLRLAGYRETVAEHGLAAAVAVGDMTEDGGYGAAVELLDAGDRPTAIFCANDMMAIGALTAAAERGLAVPGDLSLVGYDNSHLAGLRPIGLTSVDIASTAVGRHAATLLVQRIADPRRPATVHLAQPSVVVRASTAPPRR